MPRLQFLRAGVLAVAGAVVVARPLLTLAFGADYELETCANRWSLVQCGACRHVWLDPRPAVLALGVIYPATYYAYNYAKQIHPVARKAKAWLDRRKLDGIVRALERPPSSYLDVGCGDGRFLRAMEARGVPKDRLFGLELDATVADRLRAQGFRVDRARVEDSSLVAPGSLDLITMFHVIEHVDLPRAVVEKLAGWLAPGGVLALETPNRDSLDARLFRRTFWGGYHFPRHWNLFNKTSMRLLAPLGGLTVERLGTTTSPVNWTYTVRNWLDDWGAPRWLVERFSLKAAPALAVFTVVDGAFTIVGRGALLRVILRRPQ
jgi:SAM-dependent methyltransferase